MAKEVKNKISLDASGFERGTRKVRANIKSLERGLTIDLKSAVKMAGAAILGLGAAMAGIGGGIAAGVKSVIDLGGRLSDLSAQTGIAVSDLLVLEQAFADNGVSADKVGPSINKMQRAITDAGKGSKTAIDALANIGLTAQDLAALSPAEQFQKIGTAISEIKNPADRAAAAMEIFGKSGGEMLAVFGEGKIEDAAGSIGTQAQLLEKNANLFDRAGDLLGRVGTKLQGFFVGVADKVVPVILPLLEAFDKLDLAGQGVKFGESLATGMRVLIGAFQNNQLGELIWLSLKKAGLDFINLVVRGWAGIANGFFQAFVTGWASQIATIRDGLVGAAQGFGAVFLSVIATALDKIPGLGGASEAVNAKAADLFAKSEANITGALDRFTGLPGALQTAFENGMADLDGFNLFDTSDLAAQQKAIADAALAVVPAIGAAAADLLKPSEKGPLALPQIEDIEAKAGPLTGGVSSLAAIGGGGGVGAISGVESLVDQSRRQTSLLQDVKTGIVDVAKGVRETATGGGTRFAVLA